MRLLVEHPVAYYDCPMPACDTAAVSNAISGVWAWFHCDSGFSLLAVSTR